MAEAKAAGREIRVEALLCALRQNNFSDEVAKHGTEFDNRIRITSDAERKLSDKISFGDPVKTELWVRGFGRMIMPGTDLYQEPVALNLGESAGAIAEIGQTVGEALSRLLPGMSIGVANPAIPAKEIEAKRKLKAGSVEKIRTNYDVIKSGEIKPAEQTVLATILLDEKTARYQLSFKWPGNSTTIQERTLDILGDRRVNLEIKPIARQYLQTQRPQHVLAL
jgi:hypothetical protein